MDTIPAATPRNEQKDVSLLTWHVGWYPITALAPTHSVRWRVSNKRDEGSRVTRPTINIDSADRHEHTSAALTAMHLYNEQQMPEPQFYLRGNVLSRVVRDPETGVRIEPYNKTSLTEWLNRIVIFEKTRRTAGALPVPPPDYLAQAILSRAPDEEGVRDLPQLSRVTDVPVFGTDGILQGFPGYHSSARAYYTPAQSMIGMMEIGGWNRGDPYANEAQVEEVEEAKKLLLTELLGDFAFQDTASKAHALCLILEPFVRELIGAHPTPLYVIYGHQSGVGKSTLARVCLAIGNGSVQPQPYISDQDELRKQITAAMLAGNRVVYFDNVRDKVDSHVLALALTSERWSDRILGRSEQANLPVRHVWAMTANNLNMSREMGRRSIPIFLDYKDGDPNQRTEFHHPDIEVWAHEHRAELVWAALTLINQWLQFEYLGADEHGRDQFARTQTTGFLSSFREWSNVMGGILAAAGGRAFLGNLSELHEQADAETNEAGAFLADWFDRGLEPLRLDDLVAALRPAPLDGDAITLPLDLRTTGSEDFTKKFGYWLRAHRGEVANGYRIVKHGGRHSRWSVERVGHEGTE